MKTNNPELQQPLLGEQSPWLTPDDLSKRWRGKRNVRTLANWRSMGKGPKWHDFGAGPLYNIADVVAFEYGDQTEDNPTKGEG